MRPEPGMDDRARKLIERGRKDSAIIGAYMAANALVPDRVLVSPAARTVETWKFTAKAFRPIPASVTAKRLYDATPSSIISLIKKIPAAAHTLMVIGHNPGLHELGLMLIASGNVDACKRLQEKLPTAGLVIIDFSFDDWRKLKLQSGRLDRFVSPKFLQVAAK